MQEVHDYNNGRGPGPNSDDLHFDMRGVYNNPWNLKVVAILADDFKEKQGELPVRPDSYLRAIFLERFERCRVKWNVMGARIVEETGLWETPEQVESRVLKTKDNDEKVHRRATRRRNVRVFALKRYPTKR
jgi:hypothetical protein